MSCNYWSPDHDVATAECAARWSFDDETCTNVWEAMKSIKAATALMPKMVTDYIARKGLTHNVLEKQKLEAQARLRRYVSSRSRASSSRSRSSMADLRSSTTRSRCSGGWT